LQPLSPSLLPLFDLEHDLTLTPPPDLTQRLFHQLQVGLQLGLALREGPASDICQVLLHRQDLLPAVRNRLTAQETVHRHQLIQERLSGASTAASTATVGGKRRKKRESERRKKAVTKVSRNRSLDEEEEEEEEAYSEGDVSNMSSSSASQKGSTKSAVRSANTSFLYEQRLAAEAQGVCRQLLAGGWAEAEGLLSRRTRRSNRVAVLLAQSDRCQAPQGLLTTIRHYHSGGLLDDSVCEHYAPLPPLPLIAEVDLFGHKTVHDSDDEISNISSNGNADDEEEGEVDRSGQCDKTMDYARTASMNGLHPHERALVHASIADTHPPPNDLLQYVMHIAQQKYRSKVRAEQRAQAEHRKHTKKVLRASLKRSAQVEAREDRSEDEEEEEGHHKGRDRGRTAMTPAGMAMVPEQQQQGEGEGEGSVGWQGLQGRLEESSLQALALTAHDMVRDWLAAWGRDMHPNPNPNQDLHGQLRAAVFAQLNGCERPECVSPEYLLGLMEVT